MSDLTARSRLKYVVPGYVWSQGGFSIDWSPASEVLDRLSGLILIRSQSMKIREYAAASLLSLIQKRDYHADIGWTSFYAKAEHDYTGSVSTPKHRSIQVIAVKELNGKDEQVQDLAVCCDLAIIACDDLQLTLPYVEIKLSAATAGRTKL